MKLIYFTTSQGAFAHFHYYCIVYSIPLYVFVVLFEFLNMILYPAVNCTVIF